MTLFILFLFLFLLFITFYYYYYSCLRKAVAKSFNISVNNAPHSIFTKGFHFFSLASAYANKYINKYISIDVRAIGITNICQTSKVSKCWHFADDDSHVRKVYKHWSDDNREYMQRSTAKLTAVLAAFILDYHPINACLKRQV